MCVVHAAQHSAVFTNGRTVALKDIRRDVIQLQLKGFT